jgi:hypothetical protein
MGTATRGGVYLFSVSLVDMAFAFISSYCLASRNIQSSAGDEHARLRGMQFHVIA